MTEGRDETSVICDWTAWTCNSTALIRLDTVVMFELRTSDSMLSTRDDKAVTCDLTVWTCESKALIRDDIAAVMFEVAVWIFDSTASRRDDTALTCDLTVWTGESTLLIRDDSDVTCCGRPSCSSRKSSVAIGYM